MPRLYVETNLLVGIALGRELAVDALLPRGDATPQVWVPAVWFLECVVFLDGERGRRDAFDGSLGLQITQLERDATSPAASQLGSSLREARLHNKTLTSAIDARGMAAVEQLAARAGIIDLSPSILSANRLSALVRGRADNLILHCILDHARSTPGTGRQAFASDNHKDFGRAEVRAALEAADVRYFPKTADAVGWLVEPADA